MNLGLVIVGCLAAMAARSVYGQDVSFIRQYSIPISRSGFIAADVGGVYVLAASDGTLSKYDSAGNELWSSPFGGRPPMDDRFGLGGIAVSTSGVFVVGTVGGTLPGQSAAGARDAFVRRYDSAGRELWTRQFGTAGEEWGGTVAADLTGVYVAGMTNGVFTGQSRAGPFLRRYDATGRELWTRQLGGMPQDVPTGAAADASGVYVVGGLGDEAFVRRFDASGNDVWTRRLGRPTGLMQGPVAADETGVYVLYGGGGYFVRRFDQNGADSWTRPITLTTPTGGPLGTVPLAVAADTSGVYVTGLTIHALPGQCYAGGGDAFVKRYDARGNELWTRQFGTAGTEHAGGIAVDTAGVYIVGVQSGPPERQPGTFLARLEKASAPVADAKPRILMECILNAASYVGGGVAPGEFVTIFGSAMGPQTATPLNLLENRRLATTLAGVRILFNGVPAPLLYVSDKQSSAIVPYGVAGKASVSVQVEYNGVLSDTVNVPVFDVRHAIFTVDSSGRGQAAIVNEDGSINSPSRPASPGSVVSIYGTGGGLTDPPNLDGEIVNNASSHLRSNIWVGITDEEIDIGYYRFYAEVLYYGASPGSVSGLFQINARLPQNVPPGDAVPLHLQFSAFPFWTDQTVAIAIR